MIDKGVPSTTYYVVIQNSFEYNDEYYSTPEDGGGIPVKVFINEEQAQAYAYRMNKDSPAPSPQGEIGDQFTLKYEVHKVFNSIGD